MGVLKDSNGKPIPVDVRDMVVKIARARNILEKIHLELNADAKIVSRILEGMYLKIDDMGDYLEDIEVEVDAFNLEKLQREIK